MLVEAVLLDYDIAPDPRRPMIGSQSARKTVYCFYTAARFRAIPASAISCSSASGRHEIFMRVRASLEADHVTSTFSMGATRILIPRGGREEDQREQPREAGELVVGSHVVRPFSIMC